VRSAQEAWEIDLWVQLDESRSRLFLEPGHRVPRQADIRKKIPNELIREKAREYYDLLSEFTHPRYRSIVSLAEKKDNSTYVRIGGHYDKQQFLTCCYGLIPTAGLINNMLATVVPLNDEMKNHLMLVANRIAEWVQLINVEALVTPWSSVEPPSHAAIERLLREEGLSPITWDARPREMHVSHAHPCTNVLYCVRGSIRFTLDDTGQSIDLSPGDRLTLPAGTAHSATVGPEGVTCIEACRS
jgi:quercetin dioxygenase-like cupin family protein